MAEGIGGTNPKRSKTNANWQAPDLRRKRLTDARVHTIRMKRLRRIAITATCASAFLLFFICNTVLAKPTGGRPCVVEFEVPFTEKSLELPLWTWGYPLIVLAIFTVAAIGYWTALFVKWWRSRRAQTASVKAS